MGKTQAFRPELYGLARTDRIDQTVQTLRQVYSCRWVRCLLRGSSVRRCPLRLSVVLGLTVYHVCAEHVTAGVPRWPGGPGSRPWPTV